MDKCHQPALLLLERLHEAMVRGRGDKVIVAILVELDEFYPAYFVREEALLAETGYPDLEAHRRRHRALLAQLAELRRRAGIGHLAITYDTMQTMRRWIEEHVNEEDRRAAMHVMEHRLSTRHGSPADSTPAPDRACAKR